MLLVVIAIKLVAEVALLALLGRAVLGLLAGSSRQANPFFQLLDAMARPFLAVVRRVTPRVVIDRHVPLAAGVLLALVWVLATLAKINLCLQLGVQACR
jgi:uncharacterized protein YggT (Ycf19 family)